jgi:hypothetical protein
MDLGFARTRAKARALLAQLLPPHRAHALESALFFSPPVHRTPSKAYAHTYAQAVRALLRRLRDPADAGLRLSLAAGLLPPDDAIALLHADRLGLAQRVRAQHKAEAAQKPPPPDADADADAAPPSTPRAAAAVITAAPDSILYL